jgi:hypothetical protein
MKKLISLLLSLSLIFGISAVIVNAQSDYTIVSPYNEVIWDGDDAWGAYKGTLHSHSTYSDADVDLATMIKEYYNQGYDFLANTDHGITGVEWNRKQPTLLLYTYQKLSGKTIAHLTDEEFEGITTGTYPLYGGTVRGTKMTCVTGGNELNNLTLTKCHVNAFFLPEGKGNGFGGTENGFEQAVSFTQKNGGLSIINHPGDWLESNNDISTVYDEENIKLFGDILLEYDSCLGMEVFNEKNSVTPFDRILWDNLLMYTLPYGKNVIGFSNTDAHTIDNIDSSFSIFMMKENTVENIKETMQTGASFLVTRSIRHGNDIIGPEKAFDKRNSGLPYPIFTKVAVDGHKITVTVDNAQTVQFIADGKVIYKCAVGTEPITLDLDTIEGAENFRYVRAEAFGEGGLCLTQSLIIDDGSENLTYQQEKSFASFAKEIVFMLRSTRLWTIIIELYRMTK